jgi:ABC-type transporter Mla MlaB component
VSAPDVADVDSANTSPYIDSSGTCYLTKLHSANHLKTNYVHSAVWQPLCALYKRIQRGHMLRITRIDTPTQQKLILEGRLTLPWIADLSAHWEVTRHEDPERKFVVDLRGVTRMDSAGESALALMKAQGAEFLASTLRIKDFLNDLENRGPHQNTRLARQYSDLGTQRNH